MRTVGVEEEVLLVDLADGTPRPYGAAIAEGAHNGSGERDGSGIEHELKREQAELDSVPCETLDDLTTDLRRLRGELIAAASPHGLGVAPLATSPVDVEPTHTDDPRYTALVEQFGLTGREVLSCGMHVHVGVESREEGVAVLDRIRPWLPVLTALSANSPYWQGQDTGYDSYRTMVWNRWPTAGPTALWGDLATYDASIDALVRSGGILDEGMVYFDARLSAKYPTVEIRVADVCQEVADAVLIAALGRGLVETAARDWARGRPAPEFRLELLRTAGWRAARSGVGGDLLDVATGLPRPALEQVEALLLHVADALGRTGDAALVEASCRRLLARGSGADLQRSAAAAGGGRAAAALDAVRRAAGELG